MLFIRQFSTTFISISLCCALAGNVSRAIAVEPITATAAVSPGQFLFGWVAGHALDDATGLDGRVDTQSLRDDLGRYAEGDREHGVLIRQLQDDLLDKMSRDEVQRLLRKALRDVDSRLAKLADKVASQQREIADHARTLGLHESELRDLHQSVRTVEQRHFALEERHDTLLVDQQQRLMVVEVDVEHLRADYPRLRPDKQAAQLGNAGCAALMRGDHREARRAFLLGQATFPKDAGLTYGLAISLQRLGEAQAAEAALAQAVITERQYGRPQRWFSLALEKLQNGEKDWLCQARFDPAYGVRVPGDLGTAATTVAETSGR